MKVIFVKKTSLSNLSKMGECSGSVISHYKTSSISIYLSNEEPFLQDFLAFEFPENLELIVSLLLVVIIVGVVTPSYEENCIDIVVGRITPSMASWHVKRVFLCGFISWPR